MSDLAFSCNRSSQAQIESHLAACDQSFSPPLSTRVTLSDYAGKLANRATRFEAWRNDQLVGLVALYLGEGDEPRGFITNVSVLYDCRGAGVATDLMRRALSFAVSEGHDRVGLEVGADAHEALALYKKLGFRPTERVDTQIVLEWTNAGSLE